MRYEKPIVRDLGARTSRAKGQIPLGCVPGSAANNDEFESCLPGTVAGWNCGTGGTLDDFSNGCANGGNATGGGGGDCFTGTSVTWYCGAGTDGDSDPYGCNVGPTPS